MSIEVPANFLVNHVEVYAKWITGRNIKYFGNIKPEFGKR